MKETLPYKVYPPPPPPRLSQSEVIDFSKPNQGKGGGMILGLWAGGQPMELTGIWRNDIVSNYEINLYNQ